METQAAQSLTESKYDSTSQTIGGSATGAIGPDHPGVLFVRGSSPEEVLRCARVLVTAMSIPDEYWKRWMQTVYSLAVSFDIMQQLVHAGKPLVKAVRDINLVSPEILQNPTCMMLDNTWHADNRPTIPLKCAKAGDLQYSADGKSLFIKTESGKWLPVANTDGLPMKIPDHLAEAALQEQNENSWFTYTQAESIGNLLKHRAR